MQARKFLFFLVFFALFGFPCFASYISLETIVTSEVKDNTLFVFVSSVNKGDETAHAVQSEIRVGKNSFLGSPKDLWIGQAYQDKACFDLNLKEPGTYPLTVIMHYKDANQYPFSSLLVQTFTYRSSPLLPDLFCRLKGTLFWEKGKVKLVLKNKGNKEIKDLISLVLPQEISVQKEKITTNILPKSKKEIEFILENFSALSGSNYQIFAISEYSQAGKHFAVIAPASVTVKEQKNILGLSQIAVVLLAGGLLIIFVLAQFGFFKKG